MEHRTLTSRWRGLALTSVASVVKDEQVVERDVRQRWQVLLHVERSIVEMEMAQQEYHPIL
jgi:hypothetical protein